MSPSTKVRELEAELRRAGGVALRTRGSHRIWKLPSGRIVVLKVSHAGAPASPGIRCQVQRALASEPRRGS